MTEPKFPTPKQIAYTLSSIDLQHALAPRTNVDLGAHMSHEQNQEHRVTAQMQMLQQAAISAWKLDWEGDTKFPVSAVEHLGVARAENGILKNEKGTIIGTYDYNVLSGGENGQKQEAVVFFTTPFSQREN